MRILLLYIIIRFTCVAGIYNIFIYYIYLPLYIHVARDTATDAAVVGHYKGGCTCVFNGAELLN